MVVLGIVYDGLNADIRSFVFIMYYVIKCWLLFDDDSKKKTFTNGANWAIPLTVRYSEISSGPDQTNDHRRSVKSHQTLWYLESALV